MQLLIGIHLHRLPTQKMEQLAEFIKESFKKEPNTFLFVFDYFAFSEKELCALSSLTSIPPERFFLIRHGYKNRPIVSSFPPYKKSFKKAVRAISAKLGKNDKVKVVSFGGAAAFCYKRIFDGALSSLGGWFGRRLASAEPYPPLIYGRPAKPESKSAIKPRPLPRKKPLP
ncbi:MAG: hypothetical protein V1676_04130 [Candidatus Diapherotrites archaeon]